MQIANNLTKANIRSIYRLKENFEPSLTPIRSPIFEKRPYAVRKASTYRPPLPPRNPLPKKSKTKTRKNELHTTTKIWTPYIEDTGTMVRKDTCHRRKKLKQFTRIFVRKDPTHRETGTVTTTDSKFYSTVRLGTTSQLEEVNENKPSYLNNSYKYGWDQLRSTQTSQANAPSQITTTSRIDLSESSSSSSHNTSRVKKLCRKFERFQYESRF